MLQSPFQRSPFQSRGAGARTWRKTLPVWTSAVQVPWTSDGVCALPVATARTRAVASRYRMSPWIPRRGQKVEGTRVLGVRGVLRVLKVRRVLRVLSVLAARPSSNPENLENSSNPENRENPLNAENLISD